MTTKKPASRDNVTAAAADATPSLTAVAAFLDANPDFFLERPELLAAMTAPGARSTDAILGCVKSFSLA